MCAKNYNDVQGETFILCAYDIFQDAVSRFGVNDVLKIVKRMYMDL